MKGSWFYGAAALAAAGLLLAAGAFAGGNQREDVKTGVRIGVLLYRGDDTFISTLRTSLESRAKEYEQETGLKVTLDIMDAKSSQNTQNSQAERLISLNCDALCVNMVDRSAASVIIDKAIAADIPLVFFNREPVAEDMNRWEKLFYVGADAKESAVLQGQIVAEAYHENPDSLDRNGDGHVSYVILEGESSHQDSLIRTEWSIQTLKDGGVPLEKIAGGIANWEKSQASALMEQWLKAYPDEIELVISNNDDMALGAIEAMDREGILKGYIKVVGIDGTPVGQEAVSSGQLLGTVESYKDQYARMIFDLACRLSLDQPVDPEGELEEGRYFWCPQRSVTQKDLTETMTRPRWYSGS